MEELASSTLEGIGSESRLSRRFFAVCLALVVLIFAGIAPTLPWLEFSSGSEGLNVGTALEVRRTNRWLIPTLNDKTRLAKPPLTAWITAAAISDDAMRAISSTDPVERDRGFRQLGWQTRWPALLAGCIMLLATAELGRIVAGPLCGIISLLVAASSVLFLRFYRYGTTDVQLAMWVAVANVLVLWAILYRDRRWIGCVGAGAVLGLAMLSKGPVALLQSLLPIGMWVAWMKITRAAPQQSKAQRSAAADPVPVLNHVATQHAGSGPALRFAALWPGVMGIVVFLVVGLSWFAVVLLHEPRAMEIWYSETTRQGATDDPPDKWYTYFSLLLYMGPWIVLFVAGLVIAIGRRVGRDMLPVLLLFTPLLLMGFAKDRSERYMLPVLPAAAVLTGIGFIELLRSWRENRSMRGVKALLIGHWSLLSAIAIGFPLVAALVLKPTWYQQSTAFIAGMIGAIVVFAGVLLQRRWRLSVVVTTSIVMISLSALVIGGYRHTREGRAELRPLAEHIATHFPNAQAWHAHPRRQYPPSEVAIYLNRPVRWERDPSKIPAGPTPQVLFMLQFGPDGPPPVPPPGWNVIDKWKHDRNWWWAFGR